MDMRQEQRLAFLLDALLAELPENQRLVVPAAPDERRALYRALVNVRPPEPAPPDVLAAQDAFLREEARRKGIVRPEDLDFRQLSGRAALWQGDITRLAVDGIVNAANSALLGCWAPGHHCIDNAIHTAAGMQLREECHKIMEQRGRPEPVGTATVTPGFNLPSGYVIHTVGPQVSGVPTPEQEAQLAQCYRACLAAAAAHGMRTLAFCGISTGVFGFPMERAAHIAVSTVAEMLPSCTVRVIFDVFSDADLHCYSRLLTR